MPLLHSMMHFLALLKLMKHTLLHICATERSWNSSTRTQVTRQQRNKVYMSIQTQYSHLPGVLLARMPAPCRQEKVAFYGTRNNFIKNKWKMLKFLLEI